MLTVWLVNISRKGVINHKINIIKKYKKSTEENIM